MARAWSSEISKKRKGSLSLLRSFFYDDLREMNPPISMDPLTSRIVAVSSLLLSLVLIVYRPQYIYYLLLSVASATTILVSLLFLNFTISYLYHKISSAYSLDDHRTFSQPISRLRSFRPLAFSRPAAWEALEARRLAEKSRPPPRPIVDDSAAVSAAIDALIHYAVRDFVTVWFTRLTADTTFPSSIDRLVRDAARALHARVRRVDTLHLAISRIVPRITQHVSDFRRAEVAMRGASLERNLTQSDELDLLLAGQYRGGRLHQALSAAAISTKPTEVEYLRGVVNRILPFVVEERELASSSLRVLVREIVAAAVLQPVIDLLADPDYWNQLVDTYLGKAIREQKMVRKLREALDKHSSELESNKAARASAFSSSAHFRDDDSFAAADSDALFDPDAPRQVLHSFEEFLKMIKECNNLLDIKRIRNDIVTQIRKKKALIADRDMDEIINGEQVEDIVVYINRLQVAKRRADQRIAALGGLDSFKKRDTASTDKDSSSSSTVNPCVTLADILSSSAGLSYFTEFMDRRGEVIRVQFWLIIEGIIGGEAAGAENDEVISDDEHEEPPNSFDSSADADAAAAEQDTFREDVGKIYEMYLSPLAPHQVAITPSLLDEIRDFVLTPPDRFVTATMVRRARRCMARAQNEIFVCMEREDYPHFMRNDLYFKFLTTYANAGAEGQKDRRVESAPVNIVPSRTSSSSSRSSVNAVIPPPRVAVVAPTPVSVSSLAPSPQSSPDRVFRRRNSAPAVPHASDPHKSTAWTGFGFGRAAAANEASAVEDSGSVAPAEIDALQQDRGKTGLDSVAEDDDDGSTGGLEASVGSLTELGGGTELVRTDAVEAMEAELRSIMEGSTGSGNAASEGVGTDGEPDIEAETAAPSGQPPDGDSPFISPLLGPLRLWSGVGSGYGYFYNGELPTQNILSAAAAALTPKKFTSAKVSSLSASSSPTLETPLLQVTVPAAAGQDMRHGKQVDSSDSSPAQSLRRPGSIDSADSDTDEAARPSSALQKPRGGEHDEDGMSIVDMDPSAEADPSLSNDVHLAPPGDLMLAGKIDRLNEDIDRIQQQEMIVDALIRKASAQGRQNELRILKKSKSALRRELQGMVYQKSQYELQESENVLIPGRSTVNITSCTIGSENGREFALYVIEVHQLAADGNYNSGWIVARRYSEFHALHQQLKERFPVVRNYELPGKRGFLRLQRNFVEGRRIALEKYLQLLVRNPDVCQSQELKAFLSQQNIYLPRSEASEQAVPVGPTASGRSLPLHEGARRPRAPSPVSSSSIMTNSFVVPASSQSTPIFPSFTSSSRLPSTLLASSATIQPTQQKSSVAANITLSQSTSTPTSSSTPAVSLPNRSSFDRQRSAGFMKHIYKTVAEGIDDIFTGPSMLDIITQRLGQQVMEFSVQDDPTLGLANYPYYGYGEPGYESASESVAAAVAAAAASLNVDMGPPTTTAPVLITTTPNGDLKPVENEGMTSFTEPLCDLFIEVFELKEKNNWLRRQAVVIILQQIMGGTIERKLRETTKQLQSEDTIVMAISRITDSIWPNGQRPEFRPTRSAEERAVTKEEANRKLSTWLPELIGSMVGRQNSRRGARRLFTIFQNRRLNQQLMYMILDELIVALFPELEGAAMGVPGSGSVAESGHT